MGRQFKNLDVESDIILYHEIQHSKQLNEFDVEAFDDDWKITTVGKYAIF